MEIAAAARRRRFAPGLGAMIAAGLVTAPLGLSGCAGLGGRSGREAQLEAPKGETSSGASGAESGEAGDAEARVGAEARGSDGADAAAVGGNGIQYEAREEVLAAEAKRRAQAFRDRLARLRAEEEARAQERAKQAQADGARRSQAVLSELTAAEPLADATQNVKAPRPEARSRVEEPELPASWRADRSAEAVSGAAAPAAVGFGPTPEAMLRASACELQREAEAAEQRLREARARGAGATDPGAWALVVVDVSALKRDIEAELDHRGLAKAPQVCANPPDPVRALIRSLFGPGATGDAGPRATSRAVERLRRELEVRAGLPVPD